MRPIGIYDRVSRKGEREEERFHSPKEQRERATSLVVARELPVGPSFSDIDVSGAVAPWERPAMGELLKAIERGELGGVAAFSLDRLTREPSHGDELVRRVTKAGGVILTPDIPDAIDSPTGEFTFGMLLQVAKLYRSQAGARFASAKERSIKAGIPVGPLPVGLRAREDRVAEPDPELTDDIVELFELRVAGHGWTSLADHLEKVTGLPWTRQGAASVIANPVYYKGRLEYGGVVSDVTFEPIVDAPLWHAAQSAETRRKPRSKTEPWLLTGLVRCASCGNALIPWTGARRRRRDPRRGRMDWVAIANPSRRYRCTTRTCKKHASVDAPRLELFVKLQSFAMGDELATRSEAPDLGALEEAAAVAERRFTQAQSPESQDALGDAWASTLKARRLERDAAMAALGEARQSSGVSTAPLRLRELWDKMSQTERRDALALYWRAIRVGRSSKGTPLTFVARGPHAEAEVELKND